MIVGPIRVAAKMPQQYNIDMHNWQRPARFLYVKYMYINIK